MLLPVLEQVAGIPVKANTFGDNLICIHDDMYIPNIYNCQKKRSLAIAQGEYKPEGDEPKIWFESLQSMAQALSSENQELLKIIFDLSPSIVNDGHASRTDASFGAPRQEA